MGPASSRAVVMARANAGRWVTDLSHQHNEIHDLDAAVLIDCGVGNTKQGLALAGAVGTGRHPGGIDP